MPPQLPAPKSYRARLRATRELAPGTKHLEWEVTEGGALDFRAGQFLSLQLARNGQTLTRAYSIASPPRGDGRFELCLNRVAGGYASNYLCDLAPGAEINCHGPHGFFFVEPPVLNHLVFIATGTGVAPIRAILHDLFASGLDAGREIWLLFGVRYPETILYREEFERLAAGHSNFRFVPTLSRAPGDWPGARGYVQEQLRRQLSGRSDFLAYLCGLKAMVDDVRRILKEEFGLDRRRIRYEKYD